MPSIGFSTGAIALGDFERALTVLAKTSMTALELSALRMAELPRLIESLPRIDVRKFDYVSFHAPSRYSADEEDEVIHLLAQIPKDWPIILHPDTIHNCEKWTSFSSRIAIENMDRRKPLGRSAEELRHWFDLLPDARLCLDLAHAHQFDRTMTEAYRILRSFRSRVCQLHVSELDSTGHHHALSLSSLRAFSEVRSLIPERAAIILESLNPNFDATENAQSLWIEQEANRAWSVLVAEGSNSPVHIDSEPQPMIRQSMAN